VSWHVHARRGIHACIHAQHWVLPVIVVAKHTTAATLPKKVMSVLPRCMHECMEEELEPPILPIFPFGERKVG